MHPPTCDSAISPRHTTCMRMRSSAMAVAGAFSVICECEIKIVIMNVVKHVMNSVISVIESEVAGAFSVIGGWE